MATTPTSARAGKVGPFASKLERIKGLRWPYYVLIIALAAGAITLMILPAELMSEPDPEAKLDLKITFSTLVSVCVIDAMHIFDLSLPPCVPTTLC